MAGRGCGERRDWGGDSGLWARVVGVAGPPPLQVGGITEAPGGGRHRAHRGPSTALSFAALATSSLRKTTWGDSLLSVAWFSEKGRSPLRNPGMHNFCCTFILVKYLAGSLFS